MSTFTGIGPAQALDGPLPVAPRHGALSVPGVLRDGDATLLNGVNVWGYLIDTPHLWEPCLEGTFREKESESEWDQPRFDAFVSYLPIQCSTITARPEEFRDRAERALAAKLSFAVEEALAKGVDSSTNPFFGDGNLTQLGGGPVTSQIGLNHLENAIGQTGSQGLIWATPGTISDWNFVNLVTEEADGTIRTANGTIVVSAAGIYDTDPSGKTASDPAAGQEWAFATGPAFAYVWQGPNLDRAEYIDRENNVITYYAERFVLAGWDTSLQVGVLIDWVP